MERNTNALFTVKLDSFDLKVHESGSNGVAGLRAFVSMWTLHVTVKRFSKICISFDVFNTI